MNFASYAQFVILLGLFHVSNLLGTKRVVRQALAWQMCTGACVGLSIVFAAQREWFNVAFQIVMAAACGWLWWKHRNDDDDDRGKRLRRWVRSKLRRPVAGRLAQDGVR